MSDAGAGPVQPAGPASALVGRRAVIDAWRATDGEAPATVWVEREASVDVMGASAVVRYRYELEREAGGEARREQGSELWVLTRDDDRWLAGFRLTVADDPRSAGHRT